METLRTITTTENRTYKKVSNWIEIKYQYVTKRHSLSDYADFCGTDNEKEGSLTYFTFKGKKYALGQFMRLTHPEFFENEEGEQSFLCGYDRTDYYKPLMLELSDCADSVRLFEVIESEEV